MTPKMKDGGDLLTSMATLEKMPIIITDHPEAKISFLEESLMGKDWRAVVLFGVEGGLPASSLPVLRESLGSRGYLVSEARDPAGKPILNIHHLGNGTYIADVSREAGNGRGISYALTHPWILFQKPTHYAKLGGRWLVGSLTDPARANGIINTVAEVFLISAGKGAQYGKFTDPKNALLSSAGLSWFGQSITYLIFGKNNEQRAYERIERKLSQVSQAGQDITKVAFEADKDRDARGAWATFKAFMYRFTVPIGAMLNNMGMVAYLGHAWLERKHHLAQIKLNPADEMARKYIGEKGAKGFRNFIKTGFGKDVFGATLSLIGWTTLMIPPKMPRTESEIAQEHVTPLGRFWDKFREHTPTLAGLFTLGASSFRLMGATSKGNVTQQIGEKIYIGGDIALMFTNSHEYGGDKKLNPERLSDKILEYVGQQPLLMGAVQQRDFVNNTVQYWLDKNKADTEVSALSRRVPRKIVEESAIEIRQVLARKLAHQQSERFEHLCENVAEIVARFPQADHEALVESIGKNLTHQSWLRLSEQEIRQGIENAMQNLPPVKERPLSMKLIAKDALAISAIVPGIDQANTVAALYDAVAPFTANKEMIQPRRAPRTLLAGEVTHVAKGVGAENNPQFVIAANTR